MTNKQGKKTYRADNRDAMNLKLSVRYRTITRSKSNNKFKIPELENKNTTV